VLQGLLRVIFLFEDNAAIPATKKPAFSGQDIGLPITYVLPNEECHHPMRLIFSVDLVI